MRSIILTSLLAISGTLSAAEVTWQSRLSQELPLLGHRNWIVIADAAYPLQTAEGIETIATDGQMLDVVETVLGALGKTTHVKPTIYVDKELDFVEDSDAPGIAQYRAKLKQLLGGQTVKRESHEDIIKKLDVAGQTFHVLLLKTRHTQPYTSVFLQLECGYWNAAAEKKLREAIQSAASKP